METFLLTPGFEYGNMGGMDHPIKAYRKRCGLTLSEMGALIGVGKAAVFKWEHGLPPPASRAIEFEHATNGELPRWDLRPDLWSPPQEAAQ
jgi:transcriptional regulator with XRE-family HTH domain